VRLRDALALARRRLAQAGIDGAALEARLLLECATGLDRLRQIAEPDRELSFEEVERFLALVDRRCAREPLAHIRGEREFHGLGFEVSPAVLVPRPETETLVELATRHLPEGPGRLLDVGTGSGCLLVTLLHLWPQSYGVGTDLSLDALTLARRNARRHGVAARAGFVCTHLAEAVDGGMGLVVSNPPYVQTRDLEFLPPEVRLFEPRLALDGGIDGLDAYRALVPDLPRLLAPGGLAVLETGRGQAGAVAGMLREAGLEVVEIRPDLAGIPRAIAARRRTHPLRRS